MDICRALKFPGMLNRCPVCGNRLHVKVYKCTNCGTEVSGLFPQNEFSLLNEEQMKFLRIFLRSRGNLSETARYFGISNPTARNRLEGILRVLGLDEPIGSDGESLSRKEILDMLERGEISVDEAERLLKRAR